MSSLDFVPSLTRQEGKINVERVVDQYNQYSRKRQRPLSESQVAQSFILPLFSALGWDTKNPYEFTTQERVGSGYADYGVYLNGWPVYYVETKSPQVDFNNIAHAQQAIRYSYFRGITWAVLTNFEQTTTYNADIEGSPQDARFLNLSLEDYVSEKGFDRLWLLSKPAMLDGELDQAAEIYGRRPKRQPVSSVLFDQLAQWRMQLFQNFYTQKATVEAHDPQVIDDAIQKLFDRLIFLRSMEDRQIEDHILKQVVRQAKPSTLWPRLLDLFRQMDGVYNSNLFASHALDRMQLHDPDLVIKIIEGFYGQFNTEYNFSAIKADVLGRVYEQYLSFKAANALQTTEDSKRLKRKTSGIYYTPHYIVRGIVQQTVRKALKEGVPLETIRILDPACGSGSFLIEAFDVLDLAYREREPEASPERQGAWRRHILTQNLYGVDLDPQAVEIARLNLILRTALKRERLPLVDHIAQGDSLKSPDDGGFDWRKHFYGVFQEGGFDAVIGNPPYVRPESLSNDWKAYASQHYLTSKRHIVDLYVSFIERGIGLLKRGGRLGYIVPNKWMRAAYGQDLRGYLSSRIEILADFDGLPVFPDAITYPCIIIARDPALVASSEMVTSVHVSTLDFFDLSKSIYEHGHIVPRHSLTEKSWSLDRADVTSIFSKLNERGVPLAEFVNKQIYYGIKTGLNEAFVIDEFVCRFILSQDEDSGDFIKPFFAGRDVKRYATPQHHSYIICIPNGTTRKALQADPGLGSPEEWLQKSYPIIAQHLSMFQTKAMARADQGEYWWELRACAYYSAFEQPKIIVPAITKALSAMYDESGVYGNDKTTIVASGSLYLLGVLNSRPVTFFMQSIASTKQNGYYEYKPMYLQQIPIPPLSASDQQAKDIALLVESLIALHSQLSELDELHAEEKRYIREQVNRIETQIDEIVGMLYGLTNADERKIAESLTL